MPSIATWKVIQAVSGLAFGIFLIMHLSSHFLLSMGWTAAQEMLLQMREIYQNPLFEAQIVVALLAHMTSNTVLYLHRSKTTAAKDMKDDDDKDRKKKRGSQTPQPGSSELSYHRYAGYILGFSIVGHVFATRIAPLLWLDDPSVFDYSFVAKAMEVMPFNVVPIYLYIFGMAGVWHLSYGSLSALATLSETRLQGKALPQPVIMMATIGNLLLISSLLALKGTYYDIDLETKAAQHKQVLG